MTDSIRVLHVDDDPQFTELARIYLERQDDRFEVLTAPDAEKGLDVLSEEDVDCVVSDYDMPAVDGLEFLEAVRERDESIPFVLFTGQGSEAIASEAISKGVTEYLQKEVNTSQYAVLANRIANVVERHRSSRARAVTERKLSLLAEKAADVLFLYNHDMSELLFVNSAYETVYGDPVETVREDPHAFLARVHPDDREKPLRAMEQVTAGEPNEITCRIVRPDGAHRWIRVQSKPVFDDEGAVDRVVGYVRDVTDEVEARRALQRERDRFKAVFEESFDAMVIADDEGRYVDVNARAEALFGRPREEIVGRSIVEFVPDDLDFDAAWEAFRSSGVERGTVPIVRPDGSTLSVEHASSANVVPGQHLSIMREATPAGDEGDRSTTDGNRSATAER